MGTRLKPIVVLATAAAVMFPVASLGSLVSNGTYVTDTVTEIKWLRPIFTRGQSYQSVLDGYGGYTTDGWRFATQSELVNLFSTSVYPIFDWEGRDPYEAGTLDRYSDRRSTTYAPALAFVDMFDSIFFRAYLGYFWEALTVFFDYDDDLPGAGIFTARAGHSTKPFWFTKVEMHEDWTSQASDISYIGSMLVKAPAAVADIPEPATIALVGAALFGVAATRRRRLAGS